MSGSGLSTRTRSLASAALVAVLAVAGWWLQSGTDGTDGTGGAGAGADAGTHAPASSYPTSTAVPTSAGMPETDAASGLPYVALADLPPEAAATLELVDRGGPFPYDQDGSTFGNYEGLLPDHRYGYYREYTVETPGSEDRGARRIVGGAAGELYWTEDHYESFEVIWR